MESVASLSEKKSIWKRQAFIYLYQKKESQARKYFEKILRQNLNDHTIRLNIVESLLREGLFKAGLNHTSFLVLKKIKQPLKSQIQWAHGKILFFLNEYSEAKRVFRDIKIENPSFFKKQGGSFYLASALEGERDFTQAIKEMKGVQWPFSIYKEQHWKHREDNAPGRQLK